MKGVDPYSPAALVTLWPSDAEQPSFLKKDLADGSLVRKRGIPTAYPPTSFVLLTSVAWLPWHVAHLAWLVISLVAFALTVLSLAAVSGFQWQDKRAYLFLALALALAPFHTGLAAGSIVIVAVGLCALAVLAADRQWDISAGVLIALAVGLKPQIGLPFLAYYFLRRRWSTVFTSAILLMILVAAAVFRLTMSHTSWVDSYRYDSGVLFAHGSLGDFTEANPLRFGLVNLQALLYTFVPDRAQANVGALVIAGVLGLFWSFLLLRRADSESELPALAALVVLSLLPVYHRMYDASLLIFPLAWSLTALPENRKKATESLVLILVFLVPGGTMLEQLQHTSHLLLLQHSWWWAHIVMPHQVWALVFLTVILLMAMRTGTANAQVSYQNL